MRKDGEKYFIVDSHCHFWDASRENWKPGREEFAKGWIDCFYGYHQLGPPETHWDYEKYLKVTPEDFERDMFIEGHVDHVIFQSTYLKDWYTEGFNTVDQNGSLLEKWGDRLIVNGRFDPREGDAGIKQLEEDAKKYNLKGVKVYTAEWYEGSRGWRLDSPEAYRFLEKCQELGIKNIHAHKGPTIWPLDKDAFNVMDIDAAATDHQELNFIVEHAAIPRIEDFCFMAVQEPNVYAGPVRGDRRPDARPAEVLRQGHGRAAVLGRRGQDDSSAATTTSGCRSGRSRASSTGRCPTTRRSPTTASSPRPPRRRSSA